MKFVKIHYFFHKKFTNNQFSAKTCTRQWWRQEGHPAGSAAVPQKKNYFTGGHAYLSVEWRVARTFKGRSLDGTTSAKRVVRAVLFIYMFDCCRRISTKFSGSLWRKRTDGLNFRERL